MDANAWRIATPADLGAVLNHLAPAVAVLTRAHALKEDDLPAD